MRHCVSAVAGRRTDWRRDPTGPTLEPSRGITDVPLLQPPMPTSALLDSVATPDPPGNRTLARLTEHVRVLVPAGAVAIVTVEQFAGWFADPRVGEALGSQVLDADRRRALVQAALELEGPLLLPRLDGWEGSPALLTTCLLYTSPSPRDRS